MNYYATDSNTNTGTSIGIDESIKNLLTVTKLAQSKKSNLAKSKKSNLIKSKKSNFVKSKNSTLLKDYAKANFTTMDFLTFEAKKTFVYLRKSFISALRLRYPNPKGNIEIKENVMGYAISEIVS